MTPIREVVKDKGDYQGIVHHRVKPSGKRVKHPKLTAQPGYSPELFTGSRYPQMLSTVSGSGGLKRVAGLVEHAERELNLAGVGDPDADYNGGLKGAVLELIRVFADQGHSGYSAQAVLRLFNELGSYKVLTPITCEASEWEDVSVMSGYPMWQNKRDSACFTEDGGKTYFSVNEEGRGESAGAYCGRT
jgi:hypothetical protein